MPKPNSKERQAAIDRFYKYHGDFISNPVEIDIDVNAMLLLWHRHYRGKVDITKYFPDLDTTKLKLNNKAPWRGLFLSYRNSLRHHRNVNFLTTKVNIRNRTLKPSSLSDFLYRVDLPAASTH